MGLLTARLSPNVNLAAATAVLLIILCVALLAEASSKYKPLILPNLDKENLWSRLVKGFFKAGSKIISCFFLLPATLSLI